MKRTKKKKIKKEKITTIFFHYFSSRQIALFFAKNSSLLLNKPKTPFLTLCSLPLPFTPKPNPFFMAEAFFYKERKGSTVYTKNGVIPRFLPLPSSKPNFSACTFCQLQNASVTRGSKIRWRVKLCAHMHGDG